MTSSPFWRGILESLLVVSGFAGFGFAWAGLEQRDAARPHYPPPLMEAPPPTPSLWLVDGFNVLHAGARRGRDRAQRWTQPRREQLVALAERFDDAEAQIWIVFDGSGPETPGEAPASRVRRIFARRPTRAARDGSRQPGACLPRRRDGGRAVASCARHRGAQVGLAAHLPAALPGMSAPQAKRAASRRRARRRRGLCPRRNRKARHRRDQLGRALELGKGSVVAKRSIR